MHSYDCIIVGAGISGLSAAYELKQRGADVLVVEARAVPGGSIRSEQTSDGFRLENGPNTVVSSSPAMQQHFADLGIADEKVTADRSSGRRFILLDGRPELIPTSPPAMLQSPLLSTGAKLRLLAEPLLPRATTPDESVATFFARRFGTELAERMIDPFVSGVYAGNPTELSMQSTFPTLWEAEQAHGSVVGGMLQQGMRKARARKQAGTPRQRSELISFRHGLSTWPQSIVRALGAERVWFNTPATALHLHNQQWQLTVQHNDASETLQARHIILAVPAYVAANLIANLDQETARMLWAIPYPPMAVVHLGYRRDDVQHPLDGFGLLCPSRENRRVLGVLWPSSLFPDRAPADAVLTTAFVGGARRPELARLEDDEALIELVAEEQRAILGAHGTPVFAQVSRWERAIAQYTAGQAARTAQIERLERLFSGLHLLGNYRDGVSVEKCWTKGRTLGLHLPLPAEADHHTA